FAGAALARGKINLAQDYPTNPDNYVDIFTHWNNLMGDAALRVWKRFPQLMTVDHLYGIAEGTNYFDVTVQDQHGMLEGALVTLWKDDDDSIFKSGYTNEQGRVTIPLDSVTTGNVLVTVVKQDYKPYQGSFAVAALDHNINVLTNAVVIDDDSTGFSLGNGDGIINGGEQVEIHVPFKNFGTVSDSGLSAILTSTSNQVTLVTDTVEIGILDSGAVGFSAVPFVFSTDPGLEEGAPLGLRVQISDQNDNTWNGELRLEASGSRLGLYEMTVVDFSNHVLDPGESAGLQVSLQNNGTVSATGVNGILMCSSPSIVITSEASTWADLAPNEIVSNSGNIFSLTADDDILPGSTFPCFLVVTTAEGNYKSFYFELTVGIPSDGDPLGPDEYGYYIYDSGDQMYTSAPNYDWIEIDNRIGGPGEDTQIYDNGNNQDDIKEVNLPFSFNFYGNEYSMITISSNGWIALGETTLKSFRNYPLPGAGGPSPMIAAFWDDLTTTNGGKIYTYWDQPGHQFIIEWSGMRTYQQSSVEDFQVLLRDPSYFLTPTGDGEVVIQYKTFNNTSYNTGSAQTHGNYCTIGIEDPSALIGIQYTFNNEYPDAAMPLSDETALLITTRGGSVRVYGDVNQDGSLDVYDLLLLANYLDDGNPQYLSPYMADINSDGQVDLIDLIVMFQTILNEN
ncbi:MAG: dockerin type I domain-containing protein, partial [Fidelibacterota bacterium]